MIKHLILAKALLTMLVLAGATPQEAPKTTYCTPQGCTCMKMEDEPKCDNKGNRTSENPMCKSYCDMTKCACCPVP